MAHEGKTDRSQAGVGNGNEAGLRHGDDRARRPGLPLSGVGFFEKSERNSVTSCKIEFTKQPIILEVTDVSLRIIVAVDDMRVK